MGVVISIYSDYVCPFCFLAEEPLRRVGEKMGIVVDWRPFELRPEPLPTLRPEGDYLPAVWRRSVFPLAFHLGVPIRLPSVSPQPHSRLAFEGFQHAKARRVGDAYNRRVFRAFFQDGHDIGDLGLLSRLATEVGLDPVGFRADLENETYREAHCLALEEAASQRITSVPTLLIGRRRIAGLPDQAALERLIADELNAS